jgi:phosphoribosylanthranilate isomerase
MKPRVKVCGITSIDDALLCYKAGAAALGFIFAEGTPRYLSPVQAQQITTKLPPFCERVGVFVNLKVSQIAAIARQVRLSMIQLHGAETSAYIKEVAETVNLPVIKALRLANLTELNSQLAELNFKHLSALLIDGKGAGAKVSESVYQQAEQISPIPVICAGALSAENIPSSKYGLYDLCSSLEAEPGRKDASKVTKFFAALESVKEEV